MPFFKLFNNSVKIEIGVRSSFCWLNLNIVYFLDFFNGFVDIILLSFLILSYKVFDVLSKWTLVFCFKVNIIFLKSGTSLVTLAVHNVCCAFGCQLICSSWLVLLLTNTDIAKIPPIINLFFAIIIRISRITLFIFSVKLNGLISSLLTWTLVWMS